MIEHPYCGRCGRRHQDDELSMDGPFWPDTQCRGPDRSFPWFDLGFIVVVALIAYLGARYIPGGPINLLHRVEALERKAGQ